MKSKFLHIVLLAILIFLFSISVSAEERGLKPILVSPGLDSNTVSIENRCPTFSWTSVDWATGYKVVVFKTGSDVNLTYTEISTLETPIMEKEIKGKAFSWTPSSIEGLTPGIIYLWYVQATDDYGTEAWSAGRSFRVELPVILPDTEVELKDKLKKYGLNNKDISNVFSGVGSHNNSYEKTDEIPDGLTAYEGANETYYGTGAGSGTYAGDYNAFFGTNSGNSIIANGDNNSFFGHYSGSNTTSGTNNSFFGYYSGQSVTTGANNSFFGYKSGYTTIAGDNSFFGYTTGHNNLVGIRNTFLGFEAGFSNTFGNFNNFVGSNSGYNNTTGNFNIFLGSFSGYTNTTGSNNTFSGYQAGDKNLTGHRNTFLGNGAGYNNSIGSDSIFLGYQSGYNETSSNRLYIENSNSSSPLIYGEFDNNLIRINGNFQTTGYLSLNTGTNQITAAELNLLDGKTLATGTANNDQLVTKGYVDENDSVGAGLTGSVLTDHIIPKWDDGNTRLVDSIITEGTGVVSVNGSLGIGTTTPSSKIEIETTGALAVFTVDRTDGATFKLAAGVANTQIGAISNHGIKFTTNNTWKMRLNASGTLDMADGGSYNGTWNDASSIEFKENIQSLTSEEALTALEILEPVKYNYKKYKEEPRVGFIAEHVPEIVANNDRKNISPMDIVAVLTKVVKEQQRSMNKQLQINKELQKSILKLKKEINELKKDKI